MDTSKDIETKNGPSDRRPSGSQSVVQPDRNESSPRTDATRPEAPRTDDQRRDESRREEARVGAPETGQRKTDAPPNPPGLAEGDEQWTQIMAAFVDDPRRAVTMAHELAGQAIQRVVDDLNAQRAAIEQQWSRRKEADTESLRTCLQQYRAFFHRLASRASPGTSKQ
jgi:hypothetical protein